MKRFGKILLSLALVFTLGTSVCACNGRNKPKEFVSVEIGEMTTAINPYKVVIPKEPSATIEYSANEIKSYYKQVTGKDMEVVTDEDLILTEDSSFISIGNTTIFSAAQNKHGKVDLSAKTLNTDGFYIFTYGNNVIINAYNDRGLMYGAFEFIEQTLGVKFLTADYTYVPKRDTVTLWSYGKSYVPAFTQRAYLNTAVHSNEYEYVAHMRYNTDYCVMPENMGGSTRWYKFNNSAHTIPEIVPTGNYLDAATGEIVKDYRDAFAHTGMGDDMVTYKHSDGTVLDICYTSGVNANGTSDATNEKSAVSLVVEGLKTRILEDEEAEWFMIGQADRSESCPCSRCTEARNKYTPSGVMIRFINCVNARLREWITENNMQRKINLCIFAYEYNEDPPLNLQGKIIDSTVIPAKNVYVKYAPIRSIYYYSLTDEKQNDKTKGVYESWAKVTNRMMTWTYATWYANYFWYYPTMQTFTDTMKLLKASGNEYTFVQGVYNEKYAYQQDMDSYVLSKLFWDFDADVEALRNEFLRYYFGEAAYENMVLFHNTMDSNYESIAENGAKMNSNDGNFWYGFYWNINLMNDMIALFDSAIEAVKTDTSISEDQRAAYITNLSIARLTPTWMRLYNTKRFYIMSQEEVTLLAKEWVEDAEFFGVKIVGEDANKTIESIKLYYEID